jgi:hypothetical protein
VFKWCCGFISLLNFSVFFIFFYPIHNSLLIKSFQHVLQSHNLLSVFVSQLEKFQSAEREKMFWEFFSQLFRQSKIFLSSLDSLLLSTTNEYKLVNFPAFKADACSKCEREESRDLIVILKNSIFHIICVTFYTTHNEQTLKNLTFWRRRVSSKLIHSHSQFLNRKVIL